MKYRAVLAGVSACVLAVAAGAQSAAPPKKTKLSEAERIAIVRSLVAQVGIARRALPADKHGVEISPDGKILNADQVLSALDDGGSARPGDRLAITAIEFKGDRIVFSINGGPHKTHWYNHVSVGVGGATNPVGTTSQTGPHGTVITLRFAGDLPALTPAAVKADLGSLIDWDPPAKATEMVKPLPAPVRAAIDAHHVLVGMDEGMVVAAMGRTDNKSRETSANGEPYEDWVYGEPPTTTFVRFVGGRVARVTVYDHGTQTVDATPDPSLARAVTQQKQQASERAAEAAQPAPTLRRPGDPTPTLKPGGGLPPLPPNGMPPSAPPGQTGPPATGTPPVVCCQPAN